MSGTQQWLALQKQLSPNNIQVSNLKIICLFRKLHLINSLSLPKPRTPKEMVLTSPRAFQLLLELERDN